MFWYIRGCHVRIGVVVSVGSFAHPQKFHRYSKISNKEPMMNLFSGKLREMKNIILPSPVIPSSTVSAFQRNNFLKEVLNHFSISTDTLFTSHICSRHLLKCSIYPFVSFPAVQGLKHHFQVQQQFISSILFCSLNCPKLYNG